MAHRCMCVKCYGGVLVCVRAVAWCPTPPPPACPQIGAAARATDTPNEITGMKGDRYMSIIVKSNSTEPLLALWVRQIPPSDLRCASDGAGDRAGIARALRRQCWR